MDLTAIEFWYIQIVGEREAALLPEFSALHMATRLDFIITFIHSKSQFAERRDRLLSKIDGNGEPFVSSLL